MVAGLVALCAALIAAPTPAGLPDTGKRVLAVAVLAIGLWCTEALPAGVTSLVLIAALYLSGGVGGFAEALVGFSDPVAYVERIRAQCRLDEFLRARLFALARPGACKQRRERLDRSAHRERASAVS